MRKNESGLMVVEAVLSFTTFIIVCLGIIFMINIFMLHNRVQYAITSAAREIAAYSYMYDALGIRKAEETVKADGKPYTEDIEKTASSALDTVNQFSAAISGVENTVESLEDFQLNEASVNNLKGQLESLKNQGLTTYESAKKTAGNVKNLFSDPKALLIGVLYITEDAASSAVKHAIGAGAAYGLTKKYLQTSHKGGDEDSADAYLRAYGVDGYQSLDFSGSSVFCDSDNRLVDIVVEYDVDLSFLNFVWSGRKIHVVQRATVAGWVGGDKQDVSPDGKLLS